MDEYPILSAEEHNWQLCGWGDWSTITWHVYSNGFIQMFREYIPDQDVVDKYPDTKSILLKGISSINSEKLNRLKQLISEKIWRDPEIRSGGCDGTAWIMEAFDEDGNTIKTSGDLDYIYGQKVLEEIAELLPGRDKMLRCEQIFDEIEKEMRIDDIANIVEDDELGKIMIIGL